MTKKDKLAAELGKCEGKWVAVYDDKLVACGKSLEEVEKKANKANINDPVLFIVPKLGDGYYY